jgi:hypothetical protein
MPRNSSYVRYSDPRYLYLSKKACEELGNPERVELLVGRCGTPGTFVIELVAVPDDEVRTGSFKLGKVGASHSGCVISAIKVSKALGVTSRHLPIYSSLNLFKTNGRKALRGTLAAAGV